MENILIFGSVFMIVGLWGWALIDISQSRFKDSKMKTIWTFAVLFFPILGPIFYFQFRKKLITKERKRFLENYKK